MSVASLLGGRAALSGASALAARGGLKTRKRPAAFSRTIPRASIAEPPGASDVDTDAGQARAKVSMVSLGCPKNTVDGEVMLGDLFSNGFDVVDDHEEADAVWNDALASRRFIGPPSSVMCGAYVHCLGCQGRWMEAESIVKQMGERWGATRNAAVYNALLGALVRAGRLDRALAQFEAMQVGIHSNRQLNFATALIADPRGRMKHTLTTEVTPIAFLETVVD